MVEGTLTEIRLISCSVNKILFQKFIIRILGDKAIKQMKTPKDKKALQSFQEMVNYLKRYSTNLTRLFEQLKPLLREEAEWTWDSSHQDAFDTIKEELSRTPVLAYFTGKQNTLFRLTLP